MKWPHAQRVSSGTALTVIGLGAGVGVGLMGVFASFQGSRSGYRWWWPTEWMVIPGLLIALGLVFLMVPTRTSTPSKEPAPKESGALLNEFGGNAHNVVQAGRVRDVHFHQTPAGTDAANVGSSVIAGTEDVERFRVGEGAPEWEGLLRQVLRELDGRVVKDAGGVERVLSGLTASGQVVWFGRRVVQRFVSTVSDFGLVLIGGPERTVVALAGEVWETLLDVGGEAVGVDALTALGRPRPSTGAIAYVDARTSEVELVGGTWGPGRLVRMGAGEPWWWEPYNPQPETIAIRERDHWTYDAGQRLRMRLVAALHWADARHLEIAPERRSAVEDLLAESTMARLLEELSARRGAKITMPPWEAVSRHLSNTSEMLDYACTLARPDGNPVLSVEAIMSLPNSLTGTCVLCVQVSIHDLDAWRNLLIEHGATAVRADLRLTPAELAEFFARASRDAARILPTALGEQLPTRYVSAPKLQLVIAADRPRHDQPYPPLGAYVDLAPLGPRGDQDIPSLEVSITATPAADLTVGGRVTRTALQYAARRFGFIDATERSFLLDQN